MCPEMNIRQAVDQGRTGPVGHDLLQRHCQQRADERQKQHLVSLLFLMFRYFHSIQFTLVASSTDSQAYVSKINSGTPIKKVWSMIRKISGKPTGTKIPLLHVNNSEVTHIPDIANSLAQNFSVKCKM